MAINRAGQEWPESGAASISLDLFDTVSAYAYSHLTATQQSAVNFALWYAKEYPDGDKPIPQAWDYWVWNVPEN